MIMKKKTRRRSAPYSFCISLNQLVSRCGSIMPSQNTKGPMMLSISSPRAGYHIMDGGTVAEVDFQTSFVFPCRGDRGMGCWALRILCIGLRGILNGVSQEYSKQLRIMTNSWSGKN